ncbi:universal stress protein [Streptomyces sp. RKAG337]|uniref:universal stress protein n=1 Tax=Streptomyces sp. RKAG337 TaxID=2893404 RepID=UPI002033E89A|nr:universal stress protein [Streptomyces sp. RKAG337]MCM2425127.1 universal stress protein [Streptomyces sp. RKAG337]
MVAGVDGSVQGLETAEWAAVEAQRRGSALRLMGSGMPGGLDGALAAVRLRHPELSLTTWRDDCPHSALLSASAGAGLLAISAMNRDAREIAASAQCPVVLVRGTTAGEVVLGLDARHPVETATGFAFDAAHRQGRRLRVVHAWRLPAPARGRARYTLLEEDRAEWEDEEVLILHDALRGWREKYAEVDVLPDVRLFTASWALVNASARAGLVVLGRGPAGLGRVGHAVAEFAESPVAFVPA